MNLDSLPEDILNIIVKKLDIILYLLLTCKKLYSLRNNFGKLGKIRGNYIVFSKLQDIFLTTEGFLKQNRLFPISLNPVKRWILIKEVGHHRHNSYTVMVLFCDGTLEFIKLRGNYCNIAKLTLHTKAYEYLKSENSKPEYSTDRRVLLNNITDFCYKDYCLITISNNILTGYFVENNIDFYRGEIKETFSRDIEFEVDSFTANFCKDLIKLDITTKFRELVRITIKQY